MNKKKLHSKAISIRESLKKAIEAKKKNGETTHESIHKAFENICSVAVLINNAPDSEFTTPDFCMWANAKILCVPGSHRMCGDCDHY